MTHLRADENNLIQAVKNIISTLESSSPTQLQEKLKQDWMTDEDKSKLANKFNHKVGTLMKNVPALLKKAVRPRDPKDKAIPVNPYFRDLFSAVLERVCLLQINSNVQSISSGSIEEWKVINQRLRTEVEDLKQKKGRM